MRRREFISVLGSATLWPFAARAQAADKVRRVGVLPWGYRQTDPEGQARMTALLDTLGKLGWSDGRNVRVEVRWSSNEIDSIGSETAALAGSAPDIIVISSDAALTALHKRTRQCRPFRADLGPRRKRFVSSLARPGGDITGFQNFEPAMGGKWLGFSRRSRLP